MEERTQFIIGFKNNAKGNMRIMLTDGEARAVINSILNSTPYNNFVKLGDHLAIINVDEILCIVPENENFA